MPVTRRSARTEAARLPHHVLEPGTAETLPFNGFRIVGEWQSERPSAFLSDAELRDQQPNPACGKPISSGRRTHLSESIRNPPPSPVRSEELAFGRHWHSTFINVADGRQFLACSRTLGVTDVKSTIPRSDQARARRRSEWR